MRLPWLALAYSCLDNWHMLGLPYRLSLKHLARYLPPRLSNTWQFSVLISLQPPTERSPASRLALLPYTMWKSLWNRLALASLICSFPAAHSTPVLVLPVCAATSDAVLTSSINPACHLFFLSSNGSSWISFFEQVSCHLLYLLNPFFCLQVCSSPQLLLACNHLAFCSHGGFLFIWLSCQNFLPKKYLKYGNTYTLPRFL